MTYFKDLSKYTYLSNKEKNTLNVGWIDGEHEFNKGNVSDEFIFALWKYIKYPFHQTRGIHSDITLDDGLKTFVAKNEGYRIILGTFEIRVVDIEKNIVYAAPSLILHYIINHHYLPPEDFINAVINGPKPSTTEYSKVLKQILYDETDRGWSNMYCLNCGSNKLYLAHKNQREYDKSTKIEIEINKEDDYREFEQNASIYDVICKDCGKLFKVFKDNLIIL